MPLGSCSAFLMNNSVFELNLDLPDIQINSNGRSPNRCNMCKELLRERIDFVRFVNLNTFSASVALI